jgi:serine/threonine protein kinase
MADVLRFRRVDGGDHDEFPARMDDVEFPVGEFLMGRTVRLDDGTQDGLQLIQHRPVSGDRRQQGYLRLDNEILAGRRLHEVAGGAGYPTEVVRLYGDESTSADPFALFEPDPGDPLRDVAEYLLNDAFDQFLVGLLTGLSWLAGAGIAHRTLSPDTVHWDSDNGKVRFTDFSRSAPFGGARTPIAGSWSWVARESRPETCYGLVGPTDDIWAAARLIYFVRSRGKDLGDLGKLAESGLSQMFNGLLEKVFTAPEERPTARDLVEYGLRRPHILPSLPDDRGKWLIQGRASFLKARERAHPGVPVPPHFWDDVIRPPQPGEGDPQGGGR